VRESVRVYPSSKDVRASWVVRLEADDGRQASTIVDVSRTAMASLEGGTVAIDTRMVLRTQGGVARSRLSFGPGKTLRPGSSARRRATERRIGETLRT
jgi:hypothetical protein